MNAAQSLAEKIGSLSPLIPDWAAGIMVLVTAIILALAVHLLAMRLLRRMAGSDHPFLTSFLARIRGPARLAILVSAGALVARDLALPYSIAEAIGKTLLVALIVLIGWSFVITLHIAGDLHLRRFRDQGEDDLLARKHFTQVRLLLRAADLVVALLTISAALMSFETVRQYGVSLFASAGVAGIVAGFAARPVLANLIAGIQIAITQPIRVDDAVLIEGEWGWIEDITSTYVVVKLWDWRRLILPLTYFIEKPFQNWTRESTNIIGSVFLNVDYRAPVENIRRKLTDIARASPLWDGKVVVLQVTDTTEHSIQLRALVSASNSPKVWDLRCEVREKLLAFLNSEYPECLPRLRLESGAAGPEV